VAVKSLTIIPKNKAKLVLSGMSKNNYLCYYLHDDYAHLLDLQEKFSHKMDIRSLSGIFEETFKEIKESFLELMAKVNKENYSVEWWGGSIASKSTSATPLVLNITYLFCAKKILSESHKALICIIHSQALSDCIANIAKKLGYEVIRYGSRINEWSAIPIQWVRFGARIAYFLWKVWQTRRVAFKVLMPLHPKKGEAEKRVVIRSWITKGNFDKYGEFADRNFGSLPDWLRSKNYEVWCLPMFFNLPMKVREIYDLLKKQKQLFLIPQHYLKWPDYFGALSNSYRMFRKRIKKAEILNIDVSDIFNEVNTNAGFDREIYLCYRTLKRLKERGFEIDGFYYPFEGNTPEKLFIMGCRKYFGNSKIIGFQHTAFYPNQLAFQLHPRERDYHPVPDKIICSGPIYLKLYKQAGFPSEMLAEGPNLRYNSVYIDAANVKCDARDKKAILLPLTYSYDLAFDLLVKVKDALKDLSSYKVYIRSHPVLSRKVLQDFLRRIGMNNFGFADSGAIHEWFRKCDAVLSSGASITIIEAVVTGTPVIRVRPDNFFFYDPFFWDNYPLKPVDTASEIKAQLRLLDKIMNDDKSLFVETGKDVLSGYFTKPSEDNLRVFL